MTVTHYSTDAKSTLYRVGADDWAEVVEIDGFRDITFSCPELALMESLRAEILDRHDREGVAV